MRGEAKGHLGDDGGEHRYVDCQTAPHSAAVFTCVVFSRDDQLATVALPWGRRFVQSVRRAGAESDFYAVDGLKDGEDAFEKVLSAVESDSARVFRAIRGGDWPLNSEDRGTLAYLIGSVAAAGV